MAINSAWLALSHSTPYKCVGLPCGWRSPHNCLSPTSNAQPGASMPENAVEYVIEDNLSSRNPMMGPGDTSAGATVLIGGLTKLISLV